MAKMGIGPKLKTTSNYMKPVSGKPASVTVPGLPGLAGMHEASGIKPKMGRKIPGGSANGKKGLMGAC